MRLVGVGGGWDERNVRRIGEVVWGGVGLVMWGVG